MKHRLNFLLVLCLFCAASFAQTVPATSCGQQAVMQHFYATHPEYKSINQQVEKLLALRNHTLQSGNLRVQQVTGPATLPVVVHIIHNNGTENISDAQVFQGIQHLNEAYANTGYYDPADGVNTQIQFCMAQRDPANNATNGITRDVSPYTIMGGANYYSDDQSVKDINRWNPLCYINIWIVKSIPTSVVGYAYLPSAHGSNLDGIIIEAGYFGSSYANDVVAAHEMGHYLGLYHTFEGGCTNNDCTADGDKVCDTPPDQSTAGISCTSSANSCSTDMLSGFATDQNDLTQDYMDYGNFNCMKVFTQGQSDRMNWFIQNVRKSLLACKSCMNPCPAPVTADFTIPAAPFIAGSNYTFTNTSVNAASYEWYVNGFLQSSAASFSYTFPAVGSYTIKMLAHAGNALCDDAVKTITINAVCGVTAAFGKSAGTAAAGSNINFSNSSAGADSYEWYINSVLQSSATNYSYTSSTAGDYIVKLVAKNSTAGCSQTYTDTVHFTCSVLADFTPLNTATLINSPVTFSSTGSGGTSYQWLVNGAAAGSGSSFTYTFTTVGAYTIQLVSSNTVCSATQTGIEYVSDKCGNAQYQFQKSYAAENSSVAQNIRAAADGGSVLANRIISGGSVYGSILKLDAAGNVQWMNRYNGDGSSALSKTKQTADGGYIAIGYTSASIGGSSVKTFIVKTDPTGAISWSKELSLPGYTDNQGNDIIQSPDGSYYFTGAASAIGTISTTSDALAGKLDGSGNIQWLYSYDLRDTETGNGITEDNSFVVICGNRTSQLGTAGFLLKLNKANGSQAWAFTYQTSNENFTSVQTIPGGYYVDGMRRNKATGIYTDHMYIKTTTGGGITYSKYIQPFASVNNTQPTFASVVKSNGNIISQTSASIFNTPYYDFILQEIDPSKGIVWSKKYNKPNTQLTTVTLAADNSLWAAGLNTNLPATYPETYVMKLDSAGNSGSCAAESVNVELLNAIYNILVVDFKPTALQPQIASKHRATPVTAAPATLCQYVQCNDPLPADTCKLCGVFQLTGADTICSFANAVTYAVKRSFGCPAVPQWRLSDPSHGNITTVNDSTVNISFTAAGHVMLYSTLNTGCRIIKDSIDIAVLISPVSINLGPDIKLCSFSTLKLNAGSGFASYLWSDGSTDSLLTAFNPGTYSVTAKDYCGNSYSDAIDLSLGPVIPFDLGPDLQKCNNDTLSITAPGGFSSYTWAANYNINTLTGASVKIWPATDTTYTVVALVANGCTVLDTIRVKVNRSPVINIGKDTSFCAGDSTVLKAPPGFSNYTWQNGTTGNSYTAFHKGLYWLQATAANGCISKDSVTVENVYPLPIKFADIEAEVCDGKDLELKAIGNWSSYLWFNQSTANAITIHTPGTYWLQVTSSNGCTARDTITVMSSQGCRVGIWFPNAFTPDQNGYNDNYKPVVSGVPQKFRLNIYNRFGEKVFETTDYKKGWNGIYKGLKQPPGGFVWYCMYQFTGADPKMEKGALLLVR